MAKLINPHSLILTKSREVLRPKDVNFYDYDGTLLYAYTIAEANALTQLPKLPEHPGLTPKANRMSGSLNVGWNWTLQEVQTVNHIAEIGASFTTSDGKDYRLLRFYSPDDLTVSFYVPSSATIDWGDETVESVTSGDVSHTYNSALFSTYPAEIMISSQGNISERSQSKTVIYWGDGTNVGGRQLEIATRYVGGGGSCGLFFGTFTYYPSDCPRMVNCCLPKSYAVTPRAWAVNCRSLRTLVFPEGHTNVAFYGCQSLTKIFIPDSVTELGRSGYPVFGDCEQLEYCKIPASVTDIVGSQFLPYLWIFGNEYVTIDFSEHTSVPTLATTGNDFNAGNKILVPASLEQAWKTAPVWSNYASIIIGV